MLEDSEFMDVRELSRYLHIRTKTIYARIPEIPHYKIGRLVRFRRDDIDCWMEKHRVAERSQGPSSAERACLSPPNIRKPQRRKVLGRDIDRIIRKSIDEAKAEGYTPDHGKSDQVKGSGKEV